MVAYQHWVQTLLYQKKIFTCNFNVSSILVCSSIHCVLNVLSFCQLLWKTDSKTVFCEFAPFWEDVSE